jgi:GGDEF domain-containing protein
MAKNIMPKSLETGGQAVEEPIEEPAEKIIEPPRKQEKERKKEDVKFEKIRPDLLELNELKKKEKREQGEINYEQLMGSAPKKIRQLVSKRAERLAGNLPERLFNAEVSMMLKEAKDAYLDKRFEDFEVLNQAWLIMEAGEIIDRAIGDNPNEDEIYGMGIISFDLNGLKSVNDFATHDGGDEYLIRAVETLKHGKTAQKLEAMGIEVSFAARTAGGDEFSILLSGKNVNLCDITDGKSLIEQFRLEYEQEVATVDCSDLIDFSKEEVRSKFKEKELKKIPEDYKFHATISSGCSTLRDALIDYFDTDIPASKKSLPYSETLNSITGRMIKIADKNERNAKAAFKKEIAKGDKYQKTLSMILARNYETRDAEDRAAEAEAKAAVAEARAAEAEARAAVAEKENRKLEKENSAYKTKFGDLP